MKLYKVEPTPRALREVEAAFQWIYEQAPEAGVEWYEGLFDALRSLENSPKRYGLAREDDLFHEELRQMMYGRYRVIFTVRSDTVLVLHVRHSSRERLTPDIDLK